MSLRFLTPLKKASSAFTPGNLSNLQLWLAADNLSTIIKDGSNNVTSWTDQSSNAYVFTAGSTKPVWAPTTAAINNKPSMTFSGAAVLSNAVALLNGTTSSSFTFYMVVNSGANLANAPIPLFVQDSSGRGYQIAFWSNANFKNLQFGSSTVYPSVRASTDFGTVNTWYAPSLAYTGTGTSTGSLANYQFYISNVVTTTVSASASTDTSTATYIGNYRLPGSDVSGPIAEIVWQSSVGTSLERSNMETYFLNKYGL